MTRRLAQYLKARKTQPGSRELAALEDDEMEYARLKKRALRAQRNGNARITSGSVTNTVAANICRRVKEKGQLWLQFGAPEDRADAKQFVEEWEDAELINITASRR